MINQELLKIINILEQEGCNYFYDNALRKIIKPTSNNLSQINLGINRNYSIDIYNSGIFDAR